MTYSALVYNVMIASPSDVQLERNLVREVIHEWNATHSRDRRIVLQPIAWETHSHPSMSNTAQQVLNKQIVENSDLLIAIFWNRLGRPTPSSPSGSLEEINEHIRAGKPVMIYFSSAPVRPDSVDDEQYRALKDFKEDCKRKGLVETFDSPTEFRQKFARQLSSLVNDHEIFKAISGSNTESAISVESNDQYVPQLSKEAKALLMEAASDPTGYILRAVTFGGVHVQTNNKQFVEKNDPRSRAAWEGAIEELASEGLIRDAGHKGEVYQVTREGYAVAELLKD